MEATSQVVGTHRERIRSVLMVVGALVLFVAGLLLLFAPASAQEESRLQRVHSHSGGDGRIMGAQSLQASLLAGG